ncbi:hypothetical protein PoB_006878600 [Plakobranchus ocellatus]|uniref:Uncharacterized protein n=1 Tax=Plakobranchus ocellatus TaxID=259542 RepID=A0AAV4DDQ6_9GAST|nr:hypothetical protein PoB_006878600 [Plakobranchus ocellatus]
MKMKLKKGKKSNYVSSSDPDNEVMELFMSGIAEEDEVGVFENNEKCAGCRTVGDPSILWIQCETERCLLWWCSSCTNLKDLTDKEE